MIELLDRELEQEESLVAEERLPRVYLFGNLPETYEEDPYFAHGNGD